MPPGKPLALAPKASLAVEFLSALGCSACRASPAAQRWGSPQAGLRLMIDIPVDVVMMMMMRMYINLLCPSVYLSIYLLTYLSVYLSVYISCMTLVFRLCYMNSRRNFNHRQDHPGCLIEKLLALHSSGFLFIRAPLYCGFTTRGSQIGSYTGAPRTFENDD